MFSKEQIPTYVSTLTSAINVCDLFQTIVLQELQTRHPYDNDTLIHYISYLYEYTMMMDMIGSQLNQYTELINQFIVDPTYTFTDDEFHTIHSLYNTSASQIPKLISHDIHATAAFPSLPSLTPISSGIVGPSEIYIAGLLEDFKSKPVLVPYIQKCIDYILSMSSNSIALRMHYSSILSSHQEQIGGFIKSKPYHSHDMVNLGHTYIEYLKSNTVYNEIRSGEYGHYGCGSTRVCRRNLDNIVNTTGLLKEELHDYENYLKQKELDLLEEENSKYSLESDVRFFKMMSDMMVKKGKDPLPPTHATSEFIDLYTRMYLNV